MVGCEESGCDGIVEKGEKIEAGGVGRRGARGMEWDEGGIRKIVKGGNKRVNKKRREGGGMEE